VPWLALLLELENHAISTEFSANLYWPFYNKDCKTSIPGQVFTMWNLRQFLVVPIPNSSKLSCTNVLLILESS